MNKNPGPGSHYINRNLDGTCYSIGKDLRSKNQEPEEVGPGYYDIPPSVPDVPKYLLKSKKTGSKTLYKVNW